ncbi:MAG: M48 family metallopeptidase [Candidatus Hydrogenedentes bacterium]|nr:M48 family metallopeptidase [Candidatus Hydrogenedentota bacterium]
MKTCFRCLALFALLAVLAGCVTVPITGRQQLAFIPESQLTAMAIDQYGKVLSESKLSTNPDQIAMVTRVGKRLATATENYLRAQGYPNPGFTWEFNVIDDPETVNAWAMPGGKVAVYTGILPICQDDAGLAVVMGHEIAHAIARHGNERMSEGLLVALGGVALQQALKDKPAQTRDLFLQSYGAVGSVGVMLPHGRQQESEADHIGLILMASAGYDPRASVPFWQRMAGKGGPRPPEFLSTHPDPENRVNALRAWIPEAMPIYQQYAGAPVAG